VRKLIIGLLVCVIALTAVTTALAGSNPGWNRFSNQSMLCSVSKPGHSEGATCVITTGPLDGWSFIAYSYGIQVSNANDRTVFKKETTDGESGFMSNWPKGYPHKNEGVACSKLNYVVSCLIRKGGMQGWSILAAHDEIEITNLDGKVKFHHSVAS
jgi:hypothetical protein